ncbi:HlyC/CorC family transporter [uncultured Oscillibacter sp.]|uniref:HlyC/CorC family transporter n=1 Tax=uncultured Oscillibacter sp. TaxID=876091 RepID=UPI0025E5B600|nr:hemolysin family protein [uncultured Oscillibacter sp.]
MDHIGSILVMAACLAMSAYFSATETAFSSLNRNRLKVLADSGNKRAALALRLAGDYDRLISTILIGNNIVNITVASVGTLLFVELYGDVGATVSTVVVTVVVLIFGEITPKSIAKDAPERFALFSAPFIRLWIWVLTPLNFLFSQWKRLVSRFFKTDENAKMSHEELLLFMEDVEQDGGIDENEGELLRNALEFRDLTAAEILTHRIELEAVDIGESREEIANAFTRSRFSRLLVYRDTIDQIVGVLHQKDFYVNGKMTDQPIEEIMTEPLFVYQHTKIRDILKMLQHQKSHIAVVVDDFGGTLGIVTMEDILEELVGEIWDEHDEVEEDFEKLGEDVYRVDCSVNLEDFMDFFGVRLESDSVSVGGWVMERLNRVPVRGEVFTADGLEITVSELNAHRVSYITVRPCAAPAEAE